ncbi:MAG: DUF1501 domain-containing protein, partial [Hyphomicrobium denitrificans]|nr:DUF1501 domain-containing protein [Hyphomicrobium denitrificans]
MPASPTNFLSKRSSHRSPSESVVLSRSSPAATATLQSPASPLAPKMPHFAPKAKNCICIYLEGAPSQLDLFDRKPRLNELHGQKLPESLTRNVRFAFLQKDTATVMGSPRRWARYG